MFLAAFARRLAAASDFEPPARAVLRALEDTVAVATRVRIDDRGTNRE